MKSREYVLKLQEIINANNDNVMDKLQKQFPSIKDIDLTILAYLSAGFSMRSTCLLTELKEGNFYNRWYRLKKRIETCDSPDSALFRRLVTRTPSGRALSLGDSKENSLGDSKDYD